MKEGISFREAYRRVGEKLKTKADGREASPTNRYSNPLRMIWFRPYTLEQARAYRASLAQHLGIEFTEIGDDFLRGAHAGGRAHAAAVRHPARRRLGRARRNAGQHRRGLVIDPHKYRCVGQEINANHVRAVSDGFVIGTARPAAPRPAQPRVGDPHRRRAGSAGVHLAHHDVHAGSSEYERRS